MSLKHIIIGNISSFIPKNAIRITDLNPTIINYHSIFGQDYDSKVNKQIYRTEKEFEADIKYFKENYNIIGIDELIESIRKKRMIRDNALLVTVDDGLRISYDIMLPIFKKYGIQAIFFLNSAFIDNKDLHYERKKNLIIQKIKKTRDKSYFEIELSKLFNRNRINCNNIQLCIQNLPYSKKDVLEEIAELIDLNFKEVLNKYRPYMTSNQIWKLLKSGLSIGSHSIDHPNFSELTLDQQLKQAMESTSDIVNKFKLPYSLFSFPYNDHSIKQEFFNKIKSKIDITFGNSGFRIYSNNKHFPRIVIENILLGPKKSINYHFGLYFIRIIIRKNIIKRK